MTALPTEPSNDRDSKGGVRRDILLSLAGSLSFALGQWFVIFLVARTGTQEQVGYITLAGAVITPIFALGNMSMRQARAVDVGNSFSDSDYLALRGGTLLLAVLAVLMVCAVWFTDAPRALIWVIAAMTFARVIQQQSDLMYGFLQAAMRMDLIARSNVARSLLGAGVFGLLFLQTANLAIAFIGQGLIWLLIAMTTESKSLAAIGFTRKWRVWRETTWRKQRALVWWLLPLSLSAFCAMMAMMMPRLVLAQYASFATLGVFGATAYLLLASQIFVQSISQATLSRMARLYFAGRRAPFLRVAAPLFFLKLALGLSVVAFGFALGPAFIALLYGADYVNDLLIHSVFLAIGISFLSSFFGTITNAAQKFPQIFGVNAGSVIFAAVLSYMLIPSGGIEAAGLVFVLTRLLQLTLYIAAFAFAVRALER